MTDYIVPKVFLPLQVPARYKVAYSEGRDLGPIRDAVTSRRRLRAGAKGVSA